MIDFQNGDFLKLRMVNNDSFSSLLAPLLVQGEQIVASFQTVRDGVVFTNMRIISINIQGVTGKKKDMTSLPYSKIQVFSVETAGVIDMDSELDLWFSGLGKIRFEFTSRADVALICRIIAGYALR